MSTLIGASVLLLSLFCFKVVFYLFVQLQLLTSVLTEMRNAAQTKNNFVEVHLNGNFVYNTFLLLFVY